MQKCLTGLLVLFLRCCYLSGDGLSSGRLHCSADATLTVSLMPPSALLASYQGKILVHGYVETAWPMMFSLGLSTAGTPWDRCIPMVSGGVACGSN